MRYSKHRLAEVVAAGAFILILTSNVNAASSREPLSGSDPLIEEVVVTGSYIKRKKKSDLSSPLDTIGLEDIEANGWTEEPRFARRRSATWSATMRSPTSSR